MAPLEPQEERKIRDAVIEELIHSPYACSSLIQLHGGTVNFIYRGLLAEPDDNRDSTSTKPIKSIIVKHSESFLSCNKDFSIDISRCVRISPAIRPVALVLLPLQTTISDTVQLPRGLRR
jgi:hypothetical protein